MIPEHLAKPVGQQYVVDLKTAAKAEVNSYDHMFAILAGGHLRPVRDFDGRGLVILLQP
jgi:hypothetical protein